MIRPHTDSTPQGLIGRIKRRPAGRVRGRDPFREPEREPAGPAGHLHSRMEQPTRQIPRVHLEFIGEGWPLDIDAADAD